MTWFPCRKNVCCTACVHICALAMPTRQGAFGQSNAACPGSTSSHLSCMAARLCTAAAACSGKSRGHVRCAAKIGPAPTLTCLAAASACPAAADTGTTATPGSCCCSQVFQAAAAAAGTRSHLFSSSTSGSPWCCVMWRYSAWEKCSSGFLQQRQHSWQRQHQQPMYKVPASRTTSSNYKRSQCIA